MLKKILSLLKKVKKKIMNILCFIIVPPNKQEGISQFVLRQILIPDSQGRPSWTVSITAFVLALISIVTYWEIKLAQSVLKVIDVNANTVTESMKGFSTEYWGILGALTIAITYLYRSRSKDLNGKGHNVIKDKPTENLTETENKVNQEEGTTKPEEEEPSLVEKAVETITNMVQG